MTKGRVLIIQCVVLFIVVLSSGCLPDKANINVESSILGRWQVVSIETYDGSVGRQGRLVFESGGSGTIAFLDEDFNYSDPSPFAWSWGGNELDITCEQELSGNHLSDLLWSPQVRLYMLSHSDETTLLQAANSFTWENDNSIIYMSRED